MSVLRYRSNQISSADLAVQQTDLTESSRFDLVFGSGPHSVRCRC